MEIELKGELPGEGLTAIRGSNGKEATAPGYLKEGFAEFGEGPGCGGGEGCSRAVGLIGIPEEWFFWFCNVVEVGGGVTEVRAVFADEMDGGAGNVVALLVGGKNGAIVPKSDVREAEAFGENLGGQAVGSKANDGAAMY